MQKPHLRYLFIAVTMLASLMAVLFLVEARTLSESIAIQRVDQNDTIVLKLKSDLDKRDQEFKLQQELNRKLAELAKPDIKPTPEVGSAKVIYKIKTDKPVVFLTIDDGEHRIVSALDYILKEKLNPTLFLTDKFVQQDKKYFQAFKDAGIPIQNHTLNHQNLVKVSYDAQKEDVCGTSDKYKAEFGERPILFRPPYGNYNNDTLKSTKDCGMDYLIHWSALVDSGSVRYQVGNKLLAGDIVLMHFRPRMLDDLQAFKDAAQAEGLTPVSLYDWLKTN
jgi:peptidoglycan/xylan/chitin deacetylase (PgdA/CDA1 family)